MTRVQMGRTSREAHPTAYTGAMRWVPENTGLLRSGWTHLREVIMAGHVPRSRNCIGMYVDRTGPALGTDHTMPWEGAIVG